MGRADVNAALIRLDCGQWKKRPKLLDLIPRWGQAVVRKTGSQLATIGRAWAEQMGAAGVKPGPKK